MTVNTSIEFGIGIDSIKEKMKLERYLKTLLPINSRVKLEISIMGTTIHPMCNIVDYLGQENDISVYELSAIDDSYERYGYLKVLFNKDLSTSSIAKFFFSTTPEFDVENNSVTYIENVFFPEDPIKILVLGGPSGSGKTYLENYLYTDNSDKFCKLHQVTTRETRGSDDPYLFVSQEMYDKLESKLIGKIKGANKYNNSYGSLPLYEHDKINTIILSEEGYNDFKETWKENPNIVVVTTFIGTNEIDSLVERSNRDKNVVLEELKLKRLFMFDAYRDLPKTPESMKIIANNLVSLFDRRLRVDFK